MSKTLHPVVRFTGVLTAPRTWAEVEFELPRNVAWPEQLAAFLAYYLDKAADGGVFRPTRNVLWLAAGRRNHHLLPWEIISESYKTRPHCVVQRDWLRLALKSLAKLIAEAEATAEVGFSFDGKVLLMTCAGQVLAMPAKGKAWDKHFAISAAKLIPLPKCLAQEEIEIAAHGGILQIGRTFFDGVLEKQGDGN